MGFQVEANKIRNKAHRGAFEKGYNAAAEGRDVTACPYAASLDDRHGWSAVFRDRWLEGWNLYHQDSVEVREY